MEPTGTDNAYGCGSDHFILSRSALVITDTELKLIAAAAIIGLSKIPNIG